MKVGGNSSHTLQYTNRGTSGVQDTSGCPRSVRVKLALVRFRNSLQVKLRLKLEIFHFSPHLINYMYNVRFYPYGELFPL